MPENPEEREHLEDLGIDWRIILKENLNNSSAKSLTSISLLFSSRRLRKRQYDIWFQKTGLFFFYKLSRLMETARSRRFLRLDQASGESRDDVRMVRHSTQVTLAEVTASHGRFTALVNTTFRLPKGCLYTLTVAHRTTLKSTLIASRFCKLILLYATHCTISTARPLFHTTDPPFTLQHKFPHWCYLHLFSTLRPFHDVYEMTKQKR